MYNKEPWEDEQRPFSPMTEKSAEETVAFIAASAASKKLDVFLRAAIESGFAPADKPKQESRNMSNKLMDFVDEVESGLKDLEDHVDELMPRFRNAMTKGKENMTKFQGHVERAESAIQRVEEFNRKAEGSNQ